MRVRPSEPGCAHTQVMLMGRRVPKILAFQNRDTSEKRSQYRQSHSSWHPVH